MSLKTVLSVVCVATALSACTADVRTRGNIVPDSKISQVKPNVTTQYDIVRLFGPPTLRAPFEEDTVWYYTGHTTEQMGVFKNETVKQKVLRVDFDPAGVVTKVSALDPENAQDIDFVERTTPTAGKDFTIVQQLVGNIGRFNGAGGAARSDSGVNN